MGRKVDCQQRWTLLTVTVAIQLLYCLQRHALAFHYLIDRSFPISSRRGYPAFFAETEKKSSGTQTPTTNSKEKRICFITDYNVDSKYIASENDFNLTEISTTLARTLDVPIYDNVQESKYSHALLLIPYRFENVKSYALGIQELCNTDSMKPRRQRLNKKKSKSNPFIVDFIPPNNSRLGKRFQGQSGIDLLIKAASPDKKIVYDLTAGFGQDSLIMIQGGATRVVMVERDPIVTALLSDALRRLILIASNDDIADPQTRQRARDLVEKLVLETTRDAVEVANSTVAEQKFGRPDVCYIDPMFPSRKKTAAVKKNMQILHGLLGSQEIDDSLARQNEEELFKAAWSLARERVVVKRPITADSLSTNLKQQDIKPSYKIKGSTNRWDVYVK
jgi:16S rRNA (guanine1516-N2)-methyltransferase